MILLRNEGHLQSLDEQGLVVPMLVSNDMARILRWTNSVAPLLSIRVYWQRVITKNSKRNSVSLESADAVGRFTDPPEGLTLLVGLLA